MIRDTGDAWAAARSFGSALSRELGDSLIAAYVVGSLAEDAFLPGCSGVDVAVVIAGVAVDDAQERAVAVARRALDDRDAAAVHCILLCERDLAPPYSPERGVAIEVIRLLEEGRLLVGADVRDRVVRPTPDDVMAYIRHFDDLIRLSVLAHDDEEPPELRELHTLAAAACRHFIFARERLWIWKKTDALMAFRIGHEQHPMSGVVEELLRNEVSGSRAEPRLAQRVSVLWRHLHEEILA